MGLNEDRVEDRLVRGRVRLLRRKMLFESFGWAGSPTSASVETGRTQCPTRTRIEPKEATASEGVAGQFGC